MDPNATMNIKDDTYTIENTNTGEWRTVRLETQSLDASFAPGKRVLKLLTGKSNSSDYTGFAFVSATGGISVWQSKRSEAIEPSEWQKLAKFLERLFSVWEAPPEPINILPAVPCARCGELLTVPESIRRKVGPVCATRH